MRAAYIGIDLLSSALRALLDEGCEVMEIFTCDTDNKTEFNIKIKAAAKRLGVPLHTKPINLNDLKRLKDDGCSAVICAGYYHKVPILDGLPMINIHPSLLPVGRGAWPMPVMIQRGMSEGGVTLHKMTEQFDDGDIVLQERFFLSPRETLKTYTKKANDAAYRLIRSLVKDFENLYINAVPQTGGEYWSCPKEKDWTITPDMSADYMDRVFRAFYGYECILDTGRHRYEIIGGQVCDKKPSEGLFFEISGGKYITADSVSGNIEIGDKKCFDDLRQLPENQFTALSFPSLYTWKDQLGLSVIKTDSCCAVFSKHDNGYFCPMGNEKQCAEFIERLRGRGKPFKIMYLTKERAERLRAEYGAQIQLNRNLSEYVYDTRELSFEKKPVYHFKRRVVNFQKKYDYDARLITAEDLPELYEFSSKLDCDDVSVVKNALESCAELGMKGIILRGGNNFAFLIGYQNTPDMFTMSLVKTTPEWLHIADAACEHELAKCIRSPYVNMEEDLGIPGLRTVKTLTEPILMLDAWEAVFS